MRCVDPTKAKSLNIDGREFLQGQPLVGVTDKRLTDLGLDEYLIEQPDDPEALKLSQKVADKIEGDVKTASAVAGINLDNPTGNPGGTDAAADAASTTTTTAPAPAASSDAKDGKGKGGK